MRTLTSPADTGAVTLALPQDVQAEAYDYPDEFLSKRVWHVERRPPDPAALARAVAAIRSAKRPLVVAGGGVIYACASDALGRIAVTADARVTLEALTGIGYRVDPAYRESIARLAKEWDAEVSRLYALAHSPLPAQSEVIGAVNEFSGPTDVVVCAAGSMPGDLHKLWRTRDRKQYHVEYGYSCMGYEIAGALGVKLAAPEREVYALVG